jgi:hypothetical protein
MLFTSTRTPASVFGNGVAAAGVATTPVKVPNAEAIEPAATGIFGRKLALLTTATCAEAVTANASRRKPRRVRCLIKLLLDPPRAETLLVWSARSFECGTDR